MITAEQFHKLFPRNPEPAVWAEAMANVFPTYNINTPQRVAAFLAQCGHESGGWTVFEENLNYSAQGLMKVFPKYFPNADLANQYAKQPEKIANRIYGGRMGNGPESSGDGYKFRGRGFIQLTGKDNYTKCGHAIGKDLDTDPDFLTTPEGALKSALWFWNAHNLSSLADSEDILHITKKINGGTIGLEERTALYHKAKEVLSAE